MSRIDQIKELLKEDSSDLFLQYALSLELKKSGDDQNAIKAIKSILNKDEDYIGAYYTYCAWLIELGELNEALSFCVKGVEVAKRLQDHKNREELSKLKTQIQDELEW
jgi:tetratricopeptide (TPR) repeat protein